MNALRGAVVVLLTLLFFPGIAASAEAAIAAGCRLAADDPLRAEVNRVMREGTEFELQQKAALQDKVSRLGQARGWTKAEEDAYLKKVVFVGNNESWDQTLELVAAFVRVCEEQNDGNQRAEAVRLFREMYLIEEKQWRAIHDRVDRELDAANRDPGR
ncbi:MAG TPA: hypothetical protein VNM24_17380 [Burkholderiales bacterium]|nr:hypothetical protein [Burkholderiales bacterium]